MSHHHGGPTFLPAASLHMLTPLYDFGSRLLGAGPRFKRGVVQLAGIADGDRILDLACGTGVLSVIVKQLYPRSTVVGVDIDRRILEIARARIAKEGLTIELVCASAERTGLEAASFDHVLSTLAFHHLPLRIKEAAVRETMRLLRPGGTFLLVDLVPRIRTRTSFDEAQASSTRWGFAANCARILRGLLSAAGMEVHEPAPPRPWAMAPWVYAVRGVKPR